MNLLAIASLISNAYGYSEEEMYTHDAISPEIVSQDGAHMDTKTDGFYYGYYNPKENKFVAVSTEPVSEQWIYSHPAPDMHAHTHQVEPEKVHHAEHVHRVPEHVHQKTYQEYPEQWEDEYYHRAATEKLPHAEVIAYASPELSRQVAGPGDRNVYKKGKKSDSDSDMLVVAAGKPNPAKPKGATDSKKSKDDEDKPKKKSKDQDENGVAGFIIAGFLAIVALVSC